MKILITGGNGQLGQELQHLLTERGITDFDAADVEKLDITDEASVESYFAANRPEIVYHCAAYTAVDKAEGEGKAINEAVNAKGSEIISKACAKYDATLVYPSTDYIFEGNLTEGEYMPDAPTGPKNEYGRTKLLGEQAVKKYCPKHYIVRTAWVYGKYGHNFVYTMLNLAKTHDKLTVVNDQVGRPTWTRTLAEFVTYLIDNQIAYGVYQCCDDGKCSWYEFAKEILKNKDVEVLPVSSDEYPTAAFRPHYSVMHLAKETGFEFHPWQESLKKFMEQIGEE
ncbi:dTDP-4-dehydrorhamnose reductase [Ligilactobacillus agilis]|uniref:dTDP-4-dehydrorhamnose reductase n=1 Tax=Ligilactobacillus agilis TaxID=1601 RepID=UPI0022E94994|nr:dTDP-4-dehydrorhamnose reductase [Ligilactobacillus agilis]